MRIVIVPGIDDSPSDHWQSIWQESLGRSAARIEPSSFIEPEPGDWRAAISRLAGSRDILVAHSLGCLSAASWIADGGRPAGAFLVAPPDENAALFPEAAHGFAAPRTALQVPTVIIASEDDPYCSVEHLARLSEWWDAPLINVGPHGHLNRASRLGEWDEGRRLLTAFVAGTGRALPA